jgi:starch synthase (maltosyl-transferring)
MIIYNLFPLLAGTFPQWKTHLLRAAEMGFNWIFINPIQQPGSSGSLYSIKEYFQINPLFIDEKSPMPPFIQVKDMIREAERLGLKIMIDLVINHCSTDSDLIEQHPEWFIREKDGTFAHPFCMENGKKVVWKDLAKFNHSGTPDPSGLYDYFLSIIKFLIDLGFKGFRCDAAYQVPSSIWRRLIQATAAYNREVCFFAETLGCPPDQTRKTARAGFHYIFNSSKWWNFKAHWLMEQYDLTRDIAPSISFPESHDTPRLFEETQGNMDAIRLRYLFSALFSAGVMMPMGFEFGFRKRLHVVKTRHEDWEETGIDLSLFIKKVHAIKSTYAIFQEDAPTHILHQDNPNILLLWKGSASTQQEALLILNKDVDNPQSFYSENLQELVQAGAQLNDVSPEYPMDYIPAPFSYDLRPGQGIVLITYRDLVEGD